MTALCQQLWKTVLAYGVRGDNFFFKKSLQRRFSEEGDNVPRVPLCVLALRAGFSNSAPPQLPANVSYYYAGCQLFSFAFPLFLLYLV